MKRTHPFTVLPPLMGKSSKSKPKKGHEPVAPTGSASGSALLSAGDLLAHDEARLVLVRRDTGRHEWAFAERAANAPPLARMRDPLQLIEAAGRIAGADPERFWWWITDEALDATAAELTSKGFCVLDNLLGQAGATALRDEVAGVRAAGRLQASRLAGGRNGSMVTYTHTAVRGDHVGWFDGEEPGLWGRGTLARYLVKVDTLVAQLGTRMTQLGAIASRSKAMIACYPGGGARYVRHCDNSCDSGQGERCNGRRLTAIFYLNEGWAPLDGGELRVFAPYAPAGSAPLADVQPLFDRLLLFWAVTAVGLNPDCTPGTSNYALIVADAHCRQDYRVPHEVLPSHAERLAITLWYFDKGEYTRARARGGAADQTDQSETEAIEAEIAKFESRYGAGAVRDAERPVPPALAGAVA